MLRQSFFDNWIIPYGIPSSPSTDSGRQLATDLFEKLCVDPKVKPPTSTAYHQQRYDRVERYNHNLVAKLRCGISDHQKPWDEYVQPLTYEYNT